MKSFDVAIVGFGPVGATLANLLGLCGVSTVVIEKQPVVYPLPRAVQFDDEVMRVFQTIGVAERVEALCRVNPGMRFVDTNGDLLLDWPRPTSISDQGWYPSYRFHQPDLERVLRENLQRFSSVECLIGFEVVQLHSSREQVEVVCRASGDQSCERLWGKFVVGCDGANSIVRQFVGEAMEDFGFEERWLVVDAILARPKPELGDYSIQYCDPIRPSTYVRGVGDRRRWEITLLADEASEAMTEHDAIWRLLSRWISAHDAQIERAVVYTFRSLIAAQWRRRRLLLAGDAAHLTPPFLGQGMCAGIRDVSNLAWKLVRCCARPADEYLLDTYESERKPHTQAYIETAVRVGKLINNVDAESALRAAIPQADGTAKMTSIAPPLGPGFDLGIEASEHIGRLAPQFCSMGESERRLDDDVGYAFFTLNRELAKSDPRLMAYLDQVQADSVLIRPDRYVAGVAHGEAQVRLLNEQSRAWSIS